MRILSININHDASACSLNNGHLEFFCKEERLSKKKRDHSVYNCLDLYKKCDFGKIDKIVFSSPSQGTLSENIIEEQYRKQITTLFDVAAENFLIIPHHLSHAYLAYINSQFDKSLVFVIDRNGSIFMHNNEPLARESETVFIFDINNGYKTVHKNFWTVNIKYSKEEIRNIMRNKFQDVSISAENPYSIVKVYEAATTLIGENPLENGKTMGLSSYGEDINYEPLFLNGYPIDNHFDQVHVKNVESLVCFNGLNDLSTQFDENNYQFFANKAKHVQVETQNAALNLIKKYVELTGIKNVCIVGGYALNIVANNFYIKNLPNVNFYFEPNADDTGVSIGAAMAAHRKINNEWAAPLKDNFYHYYNSDDPLQTGTQSSIEEICDLLIEQKCVAIFDGSPEAGPRALGHRSILFDPRNPDAKKIINKIKKREWYRPFAGVMLESHFNEYFETLGLQSSPYMTINFSSKEIAKMTVPGIIHVDGSCRIQTVDSGFLYDLLQMFYEKTGCPILLNTSFNLAGQPLVQTKTDALNVLENSELDAIFFVEDSLIVTK